MAKYRDNLYLAAATALNGHDFDSAELALILGCSEGTAASLRSYYNTCCGDPIQMQAKANEASRNSRDRLRLAA